MKKIGFIGTGLMGFPMAKNILKSGYKLKAFNRTLSKVKALHEFGAEIAITLSELVKNSEIILGTWQGLYLFEHRLDPQIRKILFHFLGD